MMFKFRKYLLPVVAGVIVLCLILGMLSGCAPAATTDSQQELSISSPSLGEIFDPSGNPLAHRFSDEKDIRTATFVVAASDSVHRYDVDYRCSGANDHIQIQAALDALPASGGTVVLLEGSYALTQNITVPALSVVRGSGWETILTFDGADITNAFILNDDDITIADLKVVMAAGVGTAGARPNVIYATGRTRLKIDGVWVYGDKTPGDDSSESRQNGVFFDTVTESKIVNSRFENDFISDVQLFDASNDNIVTGNTMKGCSGYGILIRTNSLRNNIVSNSILNVDDTYYGYGIENIGNSDHTTIVGNSFSNTDSSGIDLDSSNYVDISGNTFAQCWSGVCASGGAHHTIVGNSVTGSFGDAIWVSGNYHAIADNVLSENTFRGISLSNVAGCSVTGNICASNDSGGTTYPGIYVTGGTSSLISGNVCRSNGLHGIYVYRSSNLQITGNVCNDQNTGDGINIEGDAFVSSDNNVITGNQCNDNASHGIEIVGGANASGNRVIDNKLSGNTTAQIADAGTDTEFNNITFQFIQGTTFLSADGSPKGWEIDLANEYAIALGQLPLELTIVVRIKIWAVGLAAPGAGNQMALEINMNAGQDDEAYTAEAIAIANKLNTTENFAVNDVIHWVVDASDDSDIGDLTGGDSLEVKMKYEDASNGDIATDAVFRVVEIEYIP